MNVFGNVFGFLFVFGSRSDSNVCVRKAALKSARSGLGVLLKRVMEGRGRIAAMHKVGVSCPFPTSCLVNLVTEAQETRYNFFAVSASKFNRKLVSFEELELSSSGAATGVGWSAQGWVCALVRNQWCCWALGGTLLKICFRREVGPLIGTWEWEAGKMHIYGHDACRKCCYGPGRALNRYGWRWGVAAVVSTWKYSS